MSEQNYNQGVLQEQRYLTRAEKIRELKSFEDYKCIPGIWRRDHSDDPGGRGRVDHEVLPLVDDLNTLDGVCTIQSCCGHRWPANDGYGGEHFMRGQLWLRLTERLMGAIDQRVGELLAHDVIVHVQRLYSFQEQGEPHDVLDVQWHEDRMDEAREVISSFFRSLVLYGAGGRLLKDEVAV